MKLPELKNEIVSILRERSTYKLGTQEYTKKNLTPTDILDLAMAYSQVQGKGTTIYGRKMDKMIAVANDLAKLNGTTQQDAKKRGNKPALILTLLKNKLVTKDEYITLYKDLLLKQTSVVKNLKNADPASRMVGGAAARAAHRDMKGSFDESAVNEVDTKKADQIRKAMPGYVGPKFAKKASDEDILAMADLKDEKAKIYNRYLKDIMGKISKLQKKYRIEESVVNERYSDFIKAKNLTDIVALSKKKKNATFYVTDDNNSRIGTFYLKNGKFAKATGGNANYDLQNSKTKLKDRSDVIYKYKIDESVVKESINESSGYDDKTGLYYVGDVPFSKERILEVANELKKMKPKSKVSQFEYTPVIIVKDKVGNEQVEIDPWMASTLVKAIKKYNIASDKDFK